MCRIDGGEVVACPLGYLSCPRFGGFAFSYVPSILSIARSPSRIMSFSCPPAAPVLCRYVPLNIGPFVAFLRVGFFVSAFPCGRAPRVGFFLTHTLSFMVTPPRHFVGFGVLGCRRAVIFLRRLWCFALHVRLAVVIFVPALLPPPSLVFLLLLVAACCPGCSGLLLVHLP